MTRKEYLEIDKKEFKKRFGFGKYYYYNKARKDNANLITEMQLKRPTEKIVLHHYIFNDDQYELWRVIPMYNDEHLKLHGKIPISNKTRKQMSESAKRVLATTDKKKRIAIGVAKTWQDPELKEKRSRNISNSMNGIGWYTNGIEDKQCFEFPEGYKPGRTNGITKGPRSEQIKQNMKGKNGIGKYIYKNNITKRVKLEELENYLNDGWQLGNLSRVKRSYSKRKFGIVN